jgi:hypothetical protein
MEGFLTRLARRALQVPSPGALRPVVGPHVPPAEPDTLGIQRLDEEIAPAPRYRAAARPPTHLGGPPFSEHAATESLARQPAAPRSAGSGSAGSGTAGSGTAGSGLAGSSLAGSGSAASGSAEVRSVAGSFESATFGSAPTATPRSTPGSEVPLVARHDQAASASGASLERMQTLETSGRLDQPLVDRGLAATPSGRPLIPADSISAIPAAPGALIPLTPPAAPPAPRREGLRDDRVLDERGAALEGMSGAEPPPPKRAEPPRDGLTQAPVGQLGAIIQQLARFNARPQPPAEASRSSVEVHIGRVEVRVLPEPAPSPEPPRTPAIELDRYLKELNERWR